jgi:hypothetical protein
MDKQEEQIVKRLAEIFIEIPAEKRERLFAKAKKRIEKERLRIKRKYLRQSFDKQFKSLREGEGPALAASIPDLRGKKKRAIDMALEIWNKKYPDKTFAELESAGIKLLDLHIFETMGFTVLYDSRPAGTE